MIITHNRLNAHGIQCFPCEPAPSKAARVSKWATWVYDPAKFRLNDLIGITPSKGLFIADLDTYKTNPRTGQQVTRADVNSFVGFELLTDATLIQRTGGGGEHHLIRLPFESVRQGTNVGGIFGFDTRVAGKGYICTGEGYEQYNGGVLSMARPDLIPVVQDKSALHDLLEVRYDSDNIPDEYIDYSLERDDSHVIEALKHIPLAGDGERNYWLKVGFALKTLYADLPTMGKQLFESWSSGAVLGVSPPEGYVEDKNEGNPNIGPTTGSVNHQWSTFKVARPGFNDIRPGTLFQLAFDNGWQKPNDFNVKMAFGTNDGDEVVFQQLYEELNGRVREETVKNASEFITNLKNSTCSRLQKSLLADELQVMLKENGGGGKTLSKELDKFIGMVSSQNNKSYSLNPVVQYEMQVIPDENTIFEDFLVPELIKFVNQEVADAQILLTKVFLNRIVSHKSDPYWWTGSYFQWIESADIIYSKVANMFISDEARATEARINNIIKSMIKQAEKVELDPPSKLVFFKNGVYDLTTNQFSSHNPKYENTRILSVAYDSSTSCPMFLGWLNDIFESEPERISLLQELLGWFLIRDTLGIQKAALFVGPTRAGKGVIAQLLETLLNSGTASFNFDTLNDGKTLASLRGKNVGIDYDAANPAARDAKSVTAFFKRITGNDSVSIPLLYKQNPWEGKLSVKLLVLVNGALSLFDDSAATANRWLPLVFDKSFLGKEDPELPSKLATELSGIAIWALHGLIRLYQRR